MDELKALIRTVPDFPKRGIMFRDITPLLQHSQGFQAVMKYVNTFRFSPSLPRAKARGVPARLPD